jgi:hypothetical protein
METSSSNLFKKNLDKAFGQPGIQLNPSTIGDANKYKQSFKEEKLEGGKSDNFTIYDIAKKHKLNVKKIALELSKGVGVEMEHTKNKKTAREIAMDHLFEDPNYYKKLKKIENNEATGSGSSGAYVGPLFGEKSDFIKKSQKEIPKLQENVDVDVDKIEATEATTSGSVGGYESPSMWAKSTKKKDWGPSRKTQIPGGSFVKVKKKCTKFPYCNQGDINALKISKNESVREAIEKISKKYGIDKNLVISLIEEEYSKISSKIKM